MVQASTLGPTQAKARMLALSWELSWWTGITVGELVEP